MLNVSEDAKLRSLSILKAEGVAVRQLFYAISDRELREIGIDRASRAEMRRIISTAMKPPTTEASALPRPTPRSLRSRQPAASFQRIARGANHTIRAQPRAGPDSGSPAFRAAGRSAAPARRAAYVGGGAAGAGGLGNRLRLRRRRRREAGGRIAGAAALARMRGA
jgi:hypothetical protein